MQDNVIKYSNDNMLENELLPFKRKIYLPLVIFLGILSAIGTIAINISTNFISSLWTLVSTVGCIASLVLYFRTKKIFIPSIIFLSSFFFSIYVPLFFSKDLFMNYVSELVFITVLFYITIMLAGILTKPIVGVILSALNILQLLFIFIITNNVEGLLNFHYNFAIVGYISLSLLSFYSNKFMIDFANKLIIKNKEIENHIETLTNNIKDISDIRNKISNSQEITDGIINDIKNQSNSILNLTNELTSKSNTLSKKIDSSVKKLDAFSNISNNVNKSIDEQIISIEENSASVEEISQTVSNINESIIQIENYSKEITELSKVSNESVNNTISNIKEINNFQFKIIDVVNVISKLSNQTNLLAMNASIEAAHAGDSGKGFSVVAEEIRQLADDSANQTKSISNIVKQMTQKINISVSNSEKTQEIFDKMNEKINNINQFIKSISSSTIEQQTSIKDVINVSSNMVNTSQRLKNFQEEQSIYKDDFNESFNDTSKFFVNFETTIKKNSDTSNNIIKLIKDIENIKNENVSLNEFIDQIIDKT